jgi:hypothetical protein
MVAITLAPTRPTGQEAPHPFSRNEIYHHLSVAIRRGDKERARRIYFDEIIPDKRFSRGEVSRLSFRLGAIDEGDRYLAEQDDL